MQTNSSVPTTDTLISDIIATYGPLLMDQALIFALLATWGATHFFKLSPFVQACKKKPLRDWYIRLMAIIFGFAAVLFFKRTELNDAVLSLAVFMAFINTALYKILTAALCKIYPAAAQIISSQPVKKKPPQ